LFQFAKFASFEQLCWPAPGGGCGETPFTNWIDYPEKLVGKDLKFGTDEGSPHQYSDLEEEYKVKFVNGTNKCELLLCYLYKVCNFDSLCCVCGCWVGINMDEHYFIILGEEDFVWFFLIFDLFEDILSFYFKT